jgi:hypothetical protein
VLLQITQKNMLSQKGQDLFLLSLCGWQTRSSGGQRIDLSAFYQEIMSRMEQTACTRRNRCGVHVWMKLIDRLENAARFDSALWGSIIEATKIVLDTYPSWSLNGKMTVIGLEAARLTVDADTAAVILKRSQDPGNSSFRTGLEICLQASNAAAADSIIDSLNDSRTGDCPIGVLRELYGLALLCHSRTGDAEKTMKYLDFMIDNDIEPE